MPSLRLPWISAWWTSKNRSLEDQSWGSRFSARPFSGHRCWARRNPARLLPACSVSPLAPRLWSHRFLRPNGDPKPPACPHAQACKPPSSTARLSPPARHSHANPPHIGSSIAPSFTGENQRWGQSTRSRAGNARKRGGKSVQRKAPDAAAASGPHHRPRRAAGDKSGFRSAAEARGRPCPARAAAAASCRLPERPGRPGPWSPRRRPRGRSSRRAAGRAPLRR